MTYDPFARGQYPVGVVSRELDDARRSGRRTEIEVWYPASALHHGEDTAGPKRDTYSPYLGLEVRQDAVRDAQAESGVFPLVIFSHGMAGHRRQSTFLCTHLASHGYIVLSADHGGSTLADLMALALRVRLENVALEVDRMLATYLSDRPRDVELMIEQAREGALLAPGQQTCAEVAIAGHSFGGFTGLLVAHADPRVRAVIALAPAGGAGPLAADALTRAIALDYGGRVETLYLAAERDSLLPLAGIEALYRRTSAPTAMYVLANADHMHFCDRAESSHEFFRKLPKVGVLGHLIGELPPFSELVPSRDGYDFACALTLAQLDAALRKRAEARTFLQGAAEQAFAARMIAVRRL
jgi:dienelactone hydrolase